MVGGFPTAGTDYTTALRPRRRSRFFLQARTHPRARGDARVLFRARASERLFSNTRRKNVSTYKRRRLFHVITDFRPVNEFFEPLTHTHAWPPRSGAHYQSLPRRVSRPSPLNFTPRIGIDPPPPPPRPRARSESRSKRAVTNPRAMCCSRDEPRARARAFRATRSPRGRLVA